MSTIEERVVHMRFDNAQFEQGIRSTVDSLHNLNRNLQMQGATRGLEEVAAAGERLPKTIEGIEKSVGSIADRFKMMGIVATTALASIAQKAIFAGGQLLNSLTLAPIMDGFHEYETNMNSIQTILANTGLEGAKGLAKVNKALSELNHYSDQTIYNFSEMAKNIGTFTAAGVSLKKATAAIKGIANLAALSGSNSEQASTAMYQLSQAISAGRVSLEDWNSVVNAGMGGKVFQNALMETARVHGVAIDKMIKDEGSFRLTLQKGWLTGKILTETLQKFTGDLSASQLKTMGYNKKQITGILKMGKTAKDAATKVKTMSQLVSTLQEGVGSGWAKTWEILFGNFTEARTLFTDVANTLGKFVSSSANARNKVLGDWKKLGGRTVLIKAISNAFHALIDVLKPIRDAFREIFPATTGKELYDFTVTLEKFTEKLKMGGKTADKLKRTFAGVFAVLGIGWDIIKEVAKTLFHLFGVATEGSGSFLDITANIGDFLVKVHDAIEKGGVLTKIFKVLGKILAFPIRMVEGLVKILVELGKAVAHVGEGGLDRFEKRLKSFGNIGKILGKVFGYVGKIFGKLAKLFPKVADKLKPFIDKFLNFVENLGSKISDGLSNVDFSQVLDAINTGLLAGVVLLFKKFLDNGLNFTGILNLSASGGVLDALKEAFGGLNDTLTAMQTNLKAKALIKIAIAIGLLAAAAIALSLVDSKKLAAATGAIGAMFIELMGSLALFEKVSGFDGYAKMPLVTAGLILLAAAIDILATAVKKLAVLDMKSLYRGLTGLTVILGELVLVMELMPNPEGLFTTALSLIVLGEAIKILVTAVTDLSGFSWNDLAKGLVGVGVLLGSLLLFTKFLEADKAGLMQGAGLLLLAYGIQIMADATTEISKLSWEGIAKGLVGIASGIAIVTAALTLIPSTSMFSAVDILITAVALGKVADALADMSKMSWQEIGKGLVAMLGSLGIIAAALYVVPPTAIGGALGIYVTALALQKIAGVLQTMSQMSWEEIGKSMVVLAGTLISIALAVSVMTGALSGAAAMIVVAAALAIMAPVLVKFSQMSWGEIVKGLTMLAGVFAVIGLAGLLLAPIVPVILGLGIAIALLGVGMLAAGAGVLLFSMALTTLAAAGSAGAAAIVLIVTGLIGLIPLVMKEIGLGIVAFAKVIATAGPAITKAIVTVLNSLIDAIAKMTPKIIKVLLKLLVLMLDKLSDAVPKMVRAGLKMLLGILKGIRDNIRDIVHVALDIISNFIDGIGDGLPKVIQSGVNLIIKFINGTAKAIDRNSTALGHAGGRLAVAIIKGMAKGIWGGISEIASAAKSVAKRALEAAKHVLGIHSPSKEFEKVGRYSDEGMAGGMVKFSHLVENSAKNVSKKALDAVKSTLSTLPDAISGEVDMNPTIRPVLDLTDLKKSARDIPKVLPASQKMFSEMAYAKARVISSMRAGGQTQDTTTASGSQSSNVTFNQYNNSPKALSSAEIYRQTNNQLSRAKEALATS